MSPLATETAAAAASDLSRAANAIVDSLGLALPWALTVIFAAGLYLTRKP